MEWTETQLDAINRVYEWYQNWRAQPVFRLFGYAGTGKTTMAKEIAAQIGGNIHFAAFTGKAASVLRRHGCPTATTLHSLIYRPKDRSRERLRELQRQLRMIKEDDALLLVERARIEKQIEEEKKKLKQPCFELNPDSIIPECDLLIIDEVSMVNQRMGEDILSFKRPVLVLGDPGQLRPVFGAGFFTNCKPDILLTEIHRQALDNPIVDLATRARTGKAIPSADYGRAKVVRGNVKKDVVKEYEQALCWRNSTRRDLNHRFRLLHGIEDSFPVRGDRLVCLRNNHDRGLLNGAIWTVDDDPYFSDDKLHLWIRSEEDVRQFVTCHKQPFIGEDVPHWDIKEAELFDYGYALTVHKAQGSQWKSVILFDESGGMSASEKRCWLYTGITRAEEELLIVR
jgi:exodeoxyribonuclease-5